MSRRRSAAKKKRNDGRPPFTRRETGCRTQLGALIAPARGSRTAPMAGSALPRQKNRPDVHAHGSRSANG